MAKFINRTVKSKTISYLVDGDTTPKTFITSTNTKDDSAIIREIAESEQVSPFEIKVTDVEQTEKEYKLPVEDFIKAATDYMAKSEA